MRHHLWKWSSVDLLRDSACFEPGDFDVGLTRAARFHAPKPRRQKNDTEIQVKTGRVCFAPCTHCVQNAESPLAPRFPPGPHTAFPHFLWISLLDFGNGERGPRIGGRWESPRAANHSRCAHLPFRLPALVDFSALDQVPAAALDDHVKTAVVFEMEGELASHQDRQLVLIIGYEAA